MDSVYWSGIASERRLSRRSLLRGAVAAGAGALALSLAGCGGGGNGNNNSSGGGSDLVAKPVDSTSRAVRGGVMPYYSNADTPGFTLYPAVSSFVTFANDRAYSKLVTAMVANAAKNEQPLSTVDPDIIAGYETSPDGLTLTMKLRPNAGFDPRPPTNGRSATVDDINYSWNLFKSTRSSRGQIANEANKNAPVLSVSTPDSSTIVFKLAFPSPSLLPNLAYQLNALYVYPVEADGKYDPARDMRGSGPWLLDKYEPSVQFQYRRNPNWYRKDRPFLDGLDMPIVTEYNSQLSQFRAGRIYTMPVKPEDILQTKRDVPALVMQRADFIFDLIGAIWFDFRPNKGSIWFDDRMRQAFSMTIDRDLVIDSVNNTKQFTDQGIPIEKKWNSHVPLGEAEYWLDPQGKDFGDTAKYFKYDLKEATRLVAAATGKSDKVESAWTIVSGNDYGAAYHQQADILQAMAQDGPFKLNTVGVDYNTYFIRFISASPNLTGGHVFDGAAYGRIASFPEIDSYFANHLYPGGTFFKFEENYPPADDKWYKLIEAQRLEQDRKKRADIIKDWQRYAAEKMYIIPFPGQASTFNLSWPWAGNYGVFRTRGTLNDLPLWLDKSKMTT